MILSFFLGRPKTIYYFIQANSSKIYDDINSLNS